MSQVSTQEIKEKSFKKSEASAEALGTEYFKNVKIKKYNFIFYL